MTRVCSWLVLFAVCFSCADFSIDTPTEPASNVESMGSLEQSELVEDGKYGDVVLSGLTVDGRKQGSWVARSVRTGIIIAELNYHAGQLHGLQQRRTPEGTLLTHITSHLGELHGDRVAWSRNGVMLQRQTYRHGVEHGALEVWHSGTRRLVLQAQFSEGIPKGDWVLRDPEGDHVCVTIRFMKQDGVLTFSAGRWGGHGGGPVPCCSWSVRGNARVRRSPGGRDAPWRVRATG